MLSSARHIRKLDAAGMQHILEDTEVRVTVLKFANLSSDLLAYGGQDGVVRIAQLGESCKICHVSIPAHA